MQLVFSKVYPASHNIVNDIKPGSDSKNADKHAFVSHVSFLSFTSHINCIVER